MMLIKQIAIGTLAVAALGGGGILVHHAVTDQTSEGRIEITSETTADVSATLDTGLAVSTDVISEEPSVSEMLADPENAQSYVIVPEEINVTGGYVRRIYAEFPASGSSYLSAEITYNADGKQILWNRYNADGFMNASYCQFDDEGRKIAEYIKSADQDWSIMELLEYGENGLAKTYYYTGANGQYSGFEVTGYDAEGRVSEKIRYSSDNVTVRSHSVFTYDADGSYTITRDTESADRNYYEKYDASGNLMEERWHYLDDPREIKNIYTLDANGDTIACDRYEDDVLKSHEDYARDEEGKLISMTKTDAEGTVTQINTYEYN